MRWADVVHHMIRGKFFTRAILFKPETCEAVMAAPDASFKLYTWTPSQSALAQSQVPGTPCVWKLTFWSFLTKTKPDHAFLSHVHGKIWPHSTQFEVMIYRTRSLAMLVTHSLHWLTNRLRLVNLIDVTLACEDAYSKLVEVVTIANVDDENRVGNSLLQIWKLRFGHKA